MSCYLNIWPIGVHVSSNILQNLYIKRPGGIAEAGSCKVTKHFTGTTLNKETFVNWFRFYQSCETALATTHAHSRQVDLSAIDKTDQLVIRRLLTYLVAGSMPLLLPIQAGGVWPVLCEYEHVEMIVSMPSFPAY